MGETSKRVLIIDDDCALARMIAITLRTDGFAVEVAGNGLAGLERLAEGEQPDAIILDMMMPVMDGRAFYRALRSRGCATPVLVLSAHNALSAARELGADDYLAKPFQPLDLTERLRRLIA
jgi:two-component system response regulator MprA